MTGDRNRAFEWAVIGFVLLAMTLGGASRDNAPQDLVLRLAAVGLGLWSFMRIAADPAREPITGAALWLVLGVLMLPLVQLIPLPPELWAALPGRRVWAEEMAGLGLPAVWRPLSLTPGATLDAFAGLLPPAAAFLAALALPARGRLRVVVAVLAFAMLSVLIGAVQLAGGSGSALRVYEHTNSHAAVGLFSNKNHFALLQLIAIPLAAFLAEPFARKGAAWGPRALMGTAIAVLIAGVAISGSRTALVLLVPAVLGVVAIHLKTGGSGHSRAASALGLVAMIGAAVAVVGAAGAWTALPHFGQALEGDVRFEIWRETLDLIVTHAPLGAGGGAFPALYQTIETPQMLTPGLINHAHNDWLEIALEYGVAGLAAVVAGLWLLIRGVRRAGRRSPLDRSLALHGGLALALICAFSLGECPLRAAALSVLAALLLGAMTVGAPGERPVRPSR
jgi:O-antigen ligase